MSLSKKNRSRLSQSTSSARSDKNLKLSSNLGKLLKKRRLALGLDLKAVEKQTKIRAHYLKLIEKNDYGSLGHHFYVQGFIKNYAEFLGFESRPILDIYTSSIKSYQSTDQPEQSSFSAKLGVKPLNSPKLIFTPKTLIATSMLAFIAIVIGYLIWQLVIFTSPPKLTIDNQPTSEVNSNFAFISGKTERQADLFINDSPILSAPDGSFREKISLSEGVNVVKITAKNKLNRSVTVTRTIIAKLPPASTSTKAASDKAIEKVDGVKVVVKITKSATWLIVSADGKEIFRGTMLSGTTQAFEAADSLKITTGNAGSTQLILSNLLILNKDLGVVGQEGEIKRDLEFKKDTLVQ